MAGWEALSAGIAATNNLAASYLSNKSAEAINDRQIRWERERAQSAHQWEVKDLEAAGLNPVLSTGGNGASTAPISPVMPDLSGIGAAGEAMSAALDRWYDNKIKKEQAKNIAADTEKKEAETEETGTKIELNKQNKSFIQKQMDKINSDIQRNNILNNKDKAEISKITHQITNIDSEVELRKVQMELEYAKKDLIKEEQLLKTIQQKQGLETYKAQIMDNKIRSVNTKMRYIDKTLDTIQKVSDIGETQSRSISNILDSLIPG